LPDCTSSKDPDHVEQWATEPASKIRESTTSNNYCVKKHINETRKTLGLGLGPFFSLGPLVHLALP
jgi:hypothetical protein